MGDDIAVAIGKRIKERREYLGMSQLEIGAPLEMGRSNVAQIESGGIKISAVWLARLADVLRCPVAYFYGDIPPADLEAEEISVIYRALPASTKPVALAVLRAMLETSEKG